MLKIVNSDGEHLMSLHDDGTEDIKDIKLKEQMESKDSKVDEDK